MHESCTNTNSLLAQISFGQLRSQQNFQPIFKSFVWENILALLFLLIFAFTFYMLKQIHLEFQNPRVRLNETKSYCFPSFSPMFSGTQDGWLYVLQALVGC